MKLQLCHYDNVEICDFRSKYCWFEKSKFNFTKIPQMLLYSMLIVYSLGRLPKFGFHRFWKLVRWIFFWSFLINLIGIIYCKLISVNIECFFEKEKQWNSNWEISSHEQSSSCSTDVGKEKDIVEIKSEKTSIILVLSPYVLNAGCKLGKSHRRQHCIVFDLWCKVLGGLRWVWSSLLRSIA